MLAVPHGIAGRRGGGGGEKKRQLAASSSQEGETLTFEEEVLRRELGPSRNLRYKQVATHCLKSNLQHQEALSLCMEAADQLFYLPHEYSPLRDELVVLEDDGTASSTRGIRQTWKVCYVRKMNNGY